ncbi:MAG: PD40 domain-containing protein [Acidobacteriia bacterium]|nr:PD40 domain-containing protein [Terriglobia bacterium]
MWIRADGGGEPQRLLQDDTRLGRIAIAVSPDGRHIVFEGPGTGIMELAIDNTDPDHPKAGISERLLDVSQPYQQGGQGGGDISPDGRWFAYSSADSGPFQVFVRPFANGKIAGPGVWQVSASGGANPVWSRAAHQLLYVTPENHLMVVDYAVEGNSFHAFKPRPWTNQIVPFPSDAFQRYDLMPDGKRVLALEADEQPQGAKVNLHATMLLNWFDELRRLSPSR